MNGSISDLSERRRYPVRVAPPTPTHGGYKVEHLDYSGLFTDCLIAVYVLYGGGGGGGNINV